MAESDPKIRAMDGSALVEGRLTLRGTSPLAASLPSAGEGDLIGVELSDPRMRRTSIDLFQKWQQAKDGLYAAGPPAISIAFGDQMPNLQKMASMMFGQMTKKLELHSPESGPGNYLLTVSFLPVGIDDALPVYGHLERAEIELVRGEDGLSIRIQGPLLPAATVPDSAIFENASLDCEVLLPRAYCRLKRFGSYWRSERQAEWHPGGEGVAAIPLSPAAIGPGCVDWQQSSSSHHCNGPFVEAYLRENELLIRPSRRLWLDPDGMCQAELDSGGPEVQLEFGRSLLASLIARKDRAEVSFKSGIGHINGQTGRSVGECGGPMTQAICHLELRLERSSSRLLVEGEGELEPLGSSNASAFRSLGPRLRFSFSLERAWLLASGIELPRFWDDWKRELGTSGVW